MCPYVCAHVQGSSARGMLRPGCVHSSACKPEPAFMWVWVWVWVCDSRCHTSCLWWCTNSVSGVWDGSYDCLTLPCALCVCAQREAEEGAARQRQLVLEECEQMRQQACASLDQLQAQMRQEVSCL